ncbi:MAG: sialidase family protein [Bacteroidota bacterium]
MKTVRLAAAIGTIVILASLFLFGFIKPTEPPLAAPGVTFSEWFKLHDTATYDFSSVLDTFSNNTVIHVHRVASGHVSTDGRLVVMYSEDGGQSWNNARTIYDSPYDDRNLNGGITADDTIVVTLGRYDAANSRWVDWGWIRSTDGGATWSAYQTFPPWTTDIHGGSQGPLLEISDRNKIGVTLYEEGSGDVGKIRIAWSADDGMSFPIIQTIYNDTVPNTQSVEPVAAYLGTGKIILLWASWVGGAYYQMTSSDYGNSWTAPALTNIVHGATGHGGWLGKSGDNLLLLYRYSGRSPPYYAYAYTDTVFSDPNAWHSGPLSTRSGDGYGAIATLSNATMLMTYSFSDEADPAHDQDLQYAFASFDDAFPSPTSQSYKLPRPLKDPVLPECNCPTAQTTRSKHTLSVAQYGVEKFQKIPSWKTTI